ncbi:MULTISPECIES: type II secretion system F family protein [unclassified Streptomyces]|uniref:type II secretion system F family protein n=1 Tax=unclassified Streptomyces TaxID=2593676 RepID=UPI00226F0923|nr:MULTISPECIES: type II secretion system F family protein [unclassified Streptomyces]MCY0923434.1 type II secretion system F family protein [Streptomyces sp. H27-G5]MCY0961856.1 type II secretion system F family protein [Streptomyces sp. H27-H5]
MTTPVAAILAGAAIGTGGALLIREVLRPAPALGPALRRLNQPPVPQAAMAGEGADRDERWGQWLVERLSDVPGVRIPYKDLALAGATPARFLLTKVALAGAGLLLPPLSTIPLLLLGLPLYLPAIVGILAAVVLWFAPDLALRDKARRARAEFAHAMAAYLDLVALRRAGNVSAEQAMEQAAEVGEGWAFQRIRGALARSRVDKVPHWESLARLTAELDLPVLDDLAAIMRQSADDGASVYATLRSRAKNLRTELLAAQAAEANANSEKMTAPGALMAVLVMLLIAFPGVIRMINT